jgi:hypothetical protein
MNFAIGAPKLVAAISLAVYSTIGASAAVANNNREGNPYTCVDGSRGNEWVIDLVDEYSDSDMLEVNLNPDCLTELAAASTILGQAMTGGAFSATRSNTSNSFSTRDQAFSFGLAPTENGTGDQVVTVSSQSPSMIGDMYQWIDVSAFRAEATGARNYDANSFQFGADFAVSPNWVVGLSMGVSDLGADFAGGTTDGDALFV